MPVVQTMPRGWPSVYSTYTEGLAIGVLVERKPYESAMCPPKPRV
jgi:hypothetical protein